jgi:hypothetical protein
MNQPETLTCRSRGQGDTGFRHLQDAGGLFLARRGLRALLASAKTGFQRSWIENHSGVWFSIQDLSVRRLARVICLDYPVPGAVACWLAGSWSARSRIGHQGPTGRARPASAQPQETSTRQSRANYRTNREPLTPADGNPGPGAEGEQPGRCPHRCSDRKRRQPSFRAAQVQDYRHVKPKPGWASAERILNAHAADHPALVQVLRKHALASRPARRLDD